MGRKAKKRVKSSHTVQHDVGPLVDNDGHVDIIGDPDDHMLGMANHALEVVILIICFISLCENATWYSSMQNYIP